VKQSSDKIGALMGLKRHEQPPEEYFDDFLREFQDRRRAELLDRSSFALMVERLGLWMRDVGNVRWAYAAGAGYALLLLGLFFWPHGEPGVNLPAAPVVNEHLVTPADGQTDEPSDANRSAKGAKGADERALPADRSSEQDF